MSFSRVAVACLLLLALASALPATAQEAEEWSLDDFVDPAWELGGTVKLLGMGYRLPQSLLTRESYEWSGLGSLRLKLEGSPVSWLGYEVHVELEEERFSESLLMGLTGVTEAPTSLFRGLDLEQTFSEGETRRLYGEVDYANLRLTVGRTDITVGRQAVTFGRSFFWNPTDWLTTFRPTEIDREYKGGVDAARISTALGRLSGVELVYAYGEDGERDESALIARIYGSWREWDLELLGGSVWVDNRIGFAFSGDVGGAGLRGELSWHQPRVTDEPDFLRATVELDYKWPSSLHLIGELHYNGWGTLDTSRYLQLLISPRITSGQVANVGVYYLGSQLSYELTPLLTTTAAVMVNLHDGSGILNPAFRLSLSNESDLVGGAIIPWGRHSRTAVMESEYGTYFDAIWLQWRLSF
jgi:hypothetical protein